MGAVTSGPGATCPDALPPVCVLTRTTPIEDLPEFLSPEEFRQYLGLGRSTVYELLRRDEVHHVRLGRCIRIPKGVLRAFAPGVQ